MQCHVVDTDQDKLDHKYIDYSFRSLNLVIERDGHVCSYNLDRVGSIKGPRRSPAMEVDAQRRIE